MNDIKIITNQSIAVKQLKINKIPLERNYLKQSTEISCIFSVLTKSLFSETDFCQNRICICLKSGNIMFFLKKDSVLSKETKPMQCDT